MPKNEFPPIEIIDNDFTTALETQDPAMEYYLDRETGELECLIDPDYVGDDEESRELRKKVKKLKRRYVRIEPIFSSEAFEIMEDFADRHTQGRVQEALFRALRGRKPFRSFKDALFEFPEVREAWFKFQQEQLNEIAREWLEARDIDAVLITYQQRNVRTPGT